MSHGKIETNKVKNPQTSSVYTILTAPMVAIAGLMTNILPSLAVTDSFYVNSTYYNDYRVCAAQLLSVEVDASKQLDVKPEEIAQSCATAIRPKDLSACVASIKKGTNISSLDALSSCRLAHRPKELATCVVSVSQNTENKFNPNVLDYCSRSLLPVTYALCVVGLRKEVGLPEETAMGSKLPQKSNSSAEKSTYKTLAPLKVMETCIDASERAGSIESGPLSTTSPVPNPQPEFMPINPSKN
jgi:hypothetical protein